MLKYAKEIISIYILFNLLNLFVCQSDKNYLYKYQQLSSNPRYSQKIEWVYVNGTSDFNCKDNITDCSNNGICLNGECKCNVGFHSLQGSYVKCSYPQKSKIIATLLECLGFGLGHLYIMNVANFCIKFFIYSYACCHYCINIFVGSATDSNVDSHVHKRTIRSFIVITPILICWYIYDIVIFLRGGYKDINNVPLY